MTFIRVRRGHSGSEQGSEVVWLVFNKVTLPVVLKQTLEGKEESRETSKEAVAVT